ncbi:MAG: site-specific DNA-methyltransferase [Fibrobacteraceae bacterium]|nr:site-specific DNA-methyltransferase [Fibrobacteraceae bacterium]
MPSLSWIGKDAVLNHHLDVPYRVLEKKYTFSSDDSLSCHSDSLSCHSERSEESQNKIIHGDNLEALKSLLPEYEGRVKCIYIDPPYNTGNENWVYNDNVNSPKIKKWLGQVVGKESEDLTRHDKWLCMMYPRLKLLQKLLSNDGAIFISIDDNEQANLKLICDEIFGAGNFVTQFIWQKKTGASDAKTISTITEYILLYAKNQNAIYFKKNVGSYDIKRYKYKDEFYESRGPYYIDNLDRGGLQYSDSLNFGIECPDGKITYPNGRTQFINDGWIWKWSKSKIDWARKNNFIEFRKSSTKESGWSVCYKNYLKVDNENNPIERAAPHKNLILDVLNAHAAADIKEIYGQLLFPYSKPVDLIKHFVDISSYKSSIILDSFAGSGTTAHAVLNLNKQDGGNRKFILVEMEDYAETITAERVRRVINGYGEGKNAVEGTGGSFAYYELGPELLKDGFINEDVPEQTIRKYLYYTETNHALPQINNGHPAHLGNFEGVAYYFFYNKSETTTLDTTFLASISEKAERYVIYADNCIMPQKFLFDHNITFKKIPRDIRRF